jgi:hypothetical protein
VEGTLEIHSVGGIFFKKGKVFFKSVLDAVSDGVLDGPVPLGVKMGV